LTQRRSATRQERPLTERLRQAVHAVRRRVRLRTRLRRLLHLWRSALPRQLPEWSPAPAGTTTGAPRATDDVGLEADARSANPVGRQRYGPKLPAGQLRLTGDGEWAVARVPDGTIVVAGHAGEPLDDRQRAVLVQLGLVTTGPGPSRRPRSSRGRDGGIQPEQLRDRRVQAVLIQLAMTGVVLHVPTPPETWSRTGAQSKGAAQAPSAAQRHADELAGELVRIITAPLVDDDPMWWEMRSVRQRRAAMRHHAAGLATPPVTAVLVSKRPHLAERNVAALAAQTYPDLQIVVGLHGADEEPPGLRRAAGERPIEVLGIDAERNLGQALDTASRVAAGDLITKVDDDDRYGPEHVWDLVLAHHFSGATVVGKGSEFVFVEPKDVTVRRRMGAEFFTDTVAGGTIALRADDLAAAGGWPPMPRFVDRGLLDRVVGAGGPVYRTHPFGFVYTRHGDGHTWDADLDHFLHDARRRWRGLIPYEEFGAGEAAG
jgi:hypothetical protein